MTRPSPGLRPPSPHCVGRGTLDRASFSPPRGEKVPEGRRRGVSLEASSEGPGGRVGIRHPTSDAPAPPGPSLDARDDRSGRLISAAAAGILAGLFLRPHPIANLRLWYVQNVEFFRWTSRLDVGNEIRPPSLYTLWTSTAFVLGLAVIGIALVYPARRRGISGEAATVAPSSLAHQRSRVYARDKVNTAIAAALFALLFIRFGRMATYVYPLAALAVVLWAGDRVRRIAPLALAGSLLLALPLARDPMLMRLLTENVVTEAELERFGRAVPAGAKVAATWGDGETYAFWAPQGRYLNVLEPLF